MRFLLIIYVSVCVRARAFSFFFKFKFLFFALAPLCFICLYEFTEMQEHELSVYATASAVWGLIC